jgi:transcriptional activator SPT8
MPPFGDDDDDRDLGGTRLSHSSLKNGSLTLRIDSQDGSSDNDIDDPMQDADDGEGEGDGDADGEDDAGGDSASNSSQGSENESSSARPNPEVLLTSPSPPDSSTKALADTPTLPKVRPEAITASTYDVVPTIAAPQSTSINTITTTADMRWVFSGGSDGYIRRYNWVDSVNGKLMLTVAQRHPFVDTVVKAGVMMTYWENWDVNSRFGLSQVSEDAVVSPVYSLAAQSQGLWLLAGLESGNIRLQSIRHEEGKEIALLQKHTSAVSVLSISSDEKSLLSGSWDKNVLDWDLNVGKVRTTFSSPAGQVSAIEPRPLSSLPIPEPVAELSITNGTFSSNNHVNGAGHVGLTNGFGSGEPSKPPAEKADSPDSLFGGDEVDDDLFGDSGGPVTANGTQLVDTFGEDDDEFSRAIADGPRPEDGPTSGDEIMADALEPHQPVQPLETVESEEKTRSLPHCVPSQSTTVLTNGIPHADDLEQPVISRDEHLSSESEPTSDSTFLATAIDGAIRIWDRRQPDPVARIAPRNTPPWCTSACWSPDGNYIYAGRRNGTVDEYDLHQGLNAPSRVFRFPHGSGAVTSVRAMPNSRHLVW